MSMIPPTPWVTPHRRGIELLRVHQHEAALEAFDEAMELGRPESLVIASRKEVLEKLRRLELTFVEANDLELDLDDLEQDAPRLFRIFARLPEELQTLLLYPPSISQSKGLSLSSQLVEFESTLDHFFSSRNLIDHLPQEVLSLIGLEVANGNGVHEVLKVALPLLWISRRWRAVFLDDPLIWSRMRYLPSRRRAHHFQRPQFFLDRGKVKELTLVIGGKEEAPALSKLLRGRVASVEVLFLENASMTMEVPFHGWGHLLDPFTSSSRLHSLNIHSYHPALPTSSCLLPSIKHLSVSGIGCRSPSLYPLLRLLPSLESCVIEGPGTTHLIHSNVDNSSTLSLPNLRSLRISDITLLFGQRQGHSEPSHIQILLPSLTTLRFKGRTDRIPSYSTYLFPTLHPSNASNLTELDLSDSNIVERDFIQHLPHLPNLLFLHLTQAEHITDATVEGLTLGRDGSGTCLGLREIWLRGTQASSVAIRRMVESRDGEGKVPMEGVDRGLPMESTAWFAFGRTPQMSTEEETEEERAEEWLRARFAR